MALFSKTSCYTGKNADSPFTNVNSSDKFQLISCSTACYTHINKAGGERNTSRHVLAVVAVIKLLPFSQAKKNVWKYLCRVHSHCFATQHRHPKCCACMCGAFLWAMQMHVLRRRTKYLQRRSVKRHTEQRIQFNVRPIWSAFVRICYSRDFAQMKMNARNMCSCCDFHCFLRHLTIIRRFSPFCVACLRTIFRFARLALFAYPGALSVCTVRHFIRLDCCLCAYAGRNVCMSDCSKSCSLFSGHGDESLISAIKNAS